MKRIIAILLTASMLLSLAACGAPTTEPKVSTEPTNTPSAEPPAAQDPVEFISLPGEVFAPVPENELQRGVYYGFVKSDYLDEPDKTATYAEFCAMISDMLAVYDNTQLTKWEETAKLALSSDREITRDCAMVAVAYAVELMGLGVGDRLMTGGLSAISVADENMTRYGITDEWDRFSCYYPEFPNWEEYSLFGSRDEDHRPFAYHATGWVYNFCSQSYLTGKEIFDVDRENKTLHPDAPLTRADAVKAVVRLAEQTKYPFITGGKPKYVSVYEAGTYDRSIITDELLAASSDLPEVAQAQLPAAWQGAGMSARKDGHHAYMDFKESDILFLSENGFNFLRLFYGFDTLSYPDYLSDRSMVNEYELKELDRLLSWCMEHGVHLQIAMSSIEGVSTMGGEFSTEYTNDEWENVAAQWEMLARRYADIPSRYLSFDLLNEASPEAHTWNRWKSGWTETIERVRAADPDRVLLYSFGGNPDLAWMKEIASLGVAIGCHPYYPNWFCAGDCDPALEYTWPLAYDDGQNPIPNEADHIDAAATFEARIKPQMDIAAQYGVGFMVNEMGIYQNRMYWPSELMTAHYEDMLSMLEEKNIPWCLCELQGWPYRFLTAPMDEWEWTGLETELATYELEGRTESFYVNKSLLDVFRKYTLN